MNVNPLIIDGGFLVAFEGIDGTGKTTIARKITERLQETGFVAEYLSEPTDGPFGRQLREIMTSVETRDPQMEFELFILDRQDDVEHNIRPVLQAGGIVCIDRYYVSSMAYQGALGLDPAMIREENEKFAPVPDLILRFDVPVDVALERISRTRPEGANQFEKREYLEKVKALFEEMNFSQMVTVSSCDTWDRVFANAWNVIVDGLEKSGRCHLRLEKL